MANICKYEVEVKGSKNVCLMVFHSMPAYDKDIDSEEQNGDLYVMNFSGSCKWSIDYEVTDAELDDIDIDAMSEEEIIEKSDDYWKYSLEAKSKAFKCAISIHHWSEESEFDEYDSFGVDDEEDGEYYYDEDEAEEIFITNPAKSFEIKNNVLMKYYQVKGITDVVIPQEVTEINDEAFRNCKSLVSINIPEGVKILGFSTFSDCENLKSITIPNSVTEIGENAFSWCTSLISITIPDSVTNIAGNAFFGCENLTSIEIPASVTNIGDYAFCNCDNLQSITIPKSVTRIGGCAFSDCPKLIITAPTGSYAIEYAKENNIKYIET